MGGFINMQTLTVCNIFKKERGKSDIPAPALSSGDSKMAPGSFGKKALL